MGPRILVRHDHAGLVAVILASGIAVTFTAVLIITALKPTPLDVQLSAVVTALTGAAVGAIGTYLGRQPGGQSDDTAPDKKVP